jgi:hypothetical protein
MHQGQSNYPKFHSHDKTLSTSEVLCQSEKLRGTEKRFSSLRVVEYPLLILTPGTSRSFRLKHTLRTGKGHLLYPLMLPLFPTKRIYRFSKTIQGRRSGQRKGAGRNDSGSSLKTLISASIKSHRALERLAGF